ncbi:MAG: hypothetical protein HOG30_04335 [Candidatus Marinimicrobia bacterium]|jgi:hypothetical protein|nr:hypothetical protein [Candidatus Neomarinimicrobiota bacterium]MBT3732298.1 hypothetical protein [Candidatus Neomarinimicrobiota bacterium]MBT4178160.1 hypothetical protein [Candidatus Neomarinimicrobiota bacterium]MBT6738122.1 hypothetical protein [Candidatus Neomarinimicrobiota bacterium]MBT6914961.1 hypothetical protein [Candidatus Neomarinimicrobiota bacterium]
MIIYKRQVKVAFLLLLLSQTSLIAQFTYSGNINPSKMIRTSNQSEIKLPFRLATIKASYTMGSFDFLTNSAIEYRWDGEPTFDFREVYVAYFPDWGEVKLGKQIHAWGMVDGNNPTDNLNAYDYYFMFMPGADRKIGSNSASVNLIFGDYQFETVIIPGHTPNRLTFGEDDFPIKPPMDEPDSYVEIEDPMEIGFRLRGSFPAADVSLSYFKGHDRLFSLSGFTLVEGGMPNFNFGFRSTEVYGANLVTFLGDMTLRGEFGYFNSKGTIIKNDFNIFDNNAEYLQYVIQLEIPGPLDIALNAQYIGSRIIEVSELTLVTLTGMVLYHQDIDTFSPGMGTPFAMFAENGLSLSATGWLMDDRLELSANTFMNLDENGYMIGARVFYSPSESWGIEAQLSQFIGDEENSENPFTKLEDFSHIQIGLKYSF